jgi:glycosyltransferase involved in cell wall biosynthesis
MKVSIIIPTYNEEKVIIKCLKSLSKQTYKDIEIIVVDDGSTDKTLKVLSGLRISDFGFRILRAEHRGPGAARNLGAKKAKGEILVFVDADMTFDKDFINRLVQPIIGGKTRGCFSKEEYVSNWENFWARCWNINEGWQERRRHPKNYPDKQKVFRAILKKEFERVGGFTPGGYNDDWSLSYKLGYEATAAPGAIFYHLNPSNLEEIFFQAVWIGKRRYKLGLIGVILALSRASLPFSLLIGIIKSIIFFQPQFLIFKVVYDFGIFIGILAYVIFKEGSK